MKRKPRTVPLFGGDWPYQLPDDYAPMSKREETRRFEEQRAQSLETERREREECERAEREEH